MKRTGSNLPRVGDYNQLLVLDLIRRAPQGVSRVELTAETGLTAQTISNISRRLLNLDLIREAGLLQLGAGAPRTILQVQPRARFAVGVHLDPARTSVVVLNLLGAVEQRLSIPTPPSHDRDAVIRSIVEAVRSVLKRGDIPVSRVSGVGVAAPGPLDTERGTLLAPPNLRGWDVVQLREDLERALDLTVVLEKDTIAAATGEAWADSEVESGNYAFIYLGTGVGVGLVMNGEILRGASDNLGEIGHLRVEPDGRECSCGARGCIGVSSLPAALVRTAASVGLIDEVDELDPAAVEQALTVVSGLADEGSPAALAIIDGCAQNFARVAADLANILDLDTIIFGGPNWSLFERRFLAIVPAELNRRVVARAVHQVAVAGTALGDDVGAIGAASLIMSRDFASANSQLLAPA